MSRASKTVVAIAAAFCALAADAAEITPLVVYSHVSDPTDGGRSDMAVDYLGIGATVGVGRSNPFEVDLTAGRRAIRCSLSSGCPTTWGGEITIRWRPKWRASK